MIKNKPAYYNQGLLEINIVNMLNQKYPMKGGKNIVKMLGSFEYQVSIALFKTLHFLLTIYVYNDIFDVASIIVTIIITIIFIVILLVIEL